MAEADTLARQLWGALREHGGKGMEFPILAFNTCAQVLIAQEDYPAAKEVLLHGYRVLMERASRIKDPARREIYLESVTENRKLNEQWQFYSQEA